MNAAADNPDFYFGASLIASELVGVTEEYFATPTPGQQNAVAAAAPPIVISQQGLFFGTHTIELALQSDNPNWEIRYTIDGSVPTAFSTLYTGPFELTTTAMMQARVFDTSPLNPVEPSPSTAATFVAADESLRNRSSDIPIIFVDTLGQALPPSSATTLATVNVAAYEVDPVTGRATLSPDNLDYLGRGGVRDRGSSTAGQPKPNMAFETWGASGTGDDDDEECRPAGLLVRQRFGTARPVYV